MQMEIIEFVLPLSASDEDSSTVLDANGRFCFRTDGNPLLAKSWAYELNSFYEERGITEVGFTHVFGECECETNG